MKLICSLRFQDEGYVRIGRCDVLRELDNRVIDERDAVLLGDEDVSWRRRPLEAEEVILFGFCMSRVRSGVCITTKYSPEYLG